MSFTNEYAVKAVRKQHQCCACCKMVEIGSPAVRWAGITEGDFHSVVYHPDCRVAEIAYNKHVGDSWEWYSLEDIEWDDWPWLIAEHPSVAARRGITTERYQAIADEQERCRKAAAEYDAKRRAEAASKRAPL